MFAIGSLPLDMEYFLNNSTHQQFFTSWTFLKQYMAKPSWENCKGKPSNNQP